MNAIALMSPLSAEDELGATRKVAVYDLEQKPRETRADRFNLCARRKLLNRGWNCAIMIRRISSMLSASQPYQCGIIAYRSPSIDSPRSRHQHRTTMNGVLKKLHSIRL
jgi:hypothetical protein